MLNGASFDLLLSLRRVGHEAIGTPYLQLCKGFYYNGLSKILNKIESIERL